MGSEMCIRDRFYNMGFFTLLAFAPFPLDMTASQVGWVFFGWGLLLAFTSVVVAPILQRMLGTVPTVIASLVLFGADLAAMAVLTDSKLALVIGIIVAGAFLGINNTLITEAVMGAGAVLVAVLVLTLGRHTLQGHLHIAGSEEPEAEAEALAISELD